MASRPLSFPKSDDERAHERVPAAAAASIRELRAVAHCVRLVDLSVAGCRIAGSDLRANDEIWVRLGKEKPIRARVIWAAKGELGCSFYSPLSRHEMQAILRCTESRPRPLFVAPSAIRGRPF
jgi:hypothetical protein